MASTTTTFVSVDMSPAVPLPPAPPAKSTGAHPVAAAAAFKLSGVSLNGVSPTSLAELLELGKARAAGDAQTGSPAAIKAFAGRKQFENDVTYFKALLETRMRMRLAHQANLQSLRDLRRRNNNLIRKRKLAAKAKRAAAIPRPAVSAEARPAQTIRQTDTDREQSVATTTTPTAPSSGITVDVTAHVPDTWQVCSSPVSTEGVDDHHHIKDSGTGLSYGCAGVAVRSAQHHVGQKESASHRA